MFVERPTWVGGDVSVYTKTRRLLTARPLIVYVFALAAAMTLPPLALSVITTSRWVEGERTRLEAGTKDKAERALAFVDRYIAGKVAMLQALATSPAIDLEDFERLDRQARELLDLQNLNIVMRDLHGQQFVNTRVPWATPLPRVPNYAIDHSVAADRKPIVSGIYEGVMAQGPLVRIIVPVLRDGDVRYTLTASLSPPALTGLLQEAGLTEPYSGSVVDKAGHIVARSVHDPAKIGQPLPGFADIVGDEGTWSGVNPSGVNVYAAYTRSALSGWVFAVGIDRTLLDAPLYRSLWWLGEVALLLALVGLAASTFIAKRILLSHRQIEIATEALGNAEIVVAPSTSLRETNRIGRALADASNRLHEQATALISANQDLEQRIEERTREVSSQSDLIKATLDNMDQGIMMIEADGTVPICNGRARELLGLPLSLMASCPTFDAVRRYQIDCGEFTSDDAVCKTWVEIHGLERTPQVYERERPNGLVLEVRTVPLPDGGAVRTYTDITARKASERVSHHMARHDALTGLPNRTLFREKLTIEINAALAGGSSIALLCIDLDRFKAVNDTLGHQAGDELLRIVGQRIRDVVADDGIVARLGGDEFSIIHLVGDQPPAANALAQSVIAAISRPIDLAGHVVHVGASAGIALAPRDGRDADHIFRSADLALYRAKQDGKSVVRFFEPSLDTAFQDRLALEQDLRAALAGGQFELYYQPLIDVEGGHITAFEALLRWNHPVRGQVQPAKFIPVAEDTRLIVPIGSWVLREACREAMRWPAPTRVLVNMSAIQIEDPALVACVLAALASSGLPPSRLELEITETIFMHESKAVLEALQKLRSLGIRIILDDFGTGYSSLSYLKHFPLDGLKIDQSFVRDHENQVSREIFFAIARLGTGLSVSVTAEGIETAEQMAFVRQSQCREMQGFLFSKPVRADAARLLVAERTMFAAA